MICTVVVSSDNMKQLTLDGKCTAICANKERTGGNRRYTTVDLIEVMTEEHYYQNAKSRDKDTDRLPKADQ